MGRRPVKQCDPSASSARSRLRIRIGRAPKSHIFSLFRKMVSDLLHQSRFARTEAPFDAKYFFCFSLRQNIVIIGIESCGGISAEGNMFSYDLSYAPPFVLYDMPGSCGCSCDRLFFNSSYLKGSYYEKKQKQKTSILSVLLCYILATLFS